MIVKVCGCFKGELQGSLISVYVRSNLYEGLSDAIMLRDMIICSLAL